MKPNIRLTVRSRKSQQGVVLFIALIVLVAMSLAGIALIRSTDTGNVIAGNIAFRQAALQESDTGVNAAFLALSDALGAGYIANKAATNLAPRYYPVMQALGTNGAPTAVNNMTSSDAVGTADVYAAGIGTNGNRIRYVIERMCTLTPAGPGGGLPPATSAEILANCIVYTPGSTDNSSRNAGRIKMAAVSTTNVYYRVTIRVDGPRNTVSMAQAMVRI